MTAKNQSSKKPSDLVDEQLEAYRAMRDFSVTSEPAGAAGQKASKAKSRRGTATEAARANTGTLPFVIQKHAASHLHYDFRLGWNGVLKSWAVAKGPSYVTKDKRLAVQVEDHPIEYGGFEGIIPQGQYGGGTVLLWDTGTWEPQTGHEDIEAGLKEGSLKFVIHGTKMKGKWALIRMGGRAANEKKPNWLLIKEHDSFERSEDASAITDESPESVVTGRSLEEIASQKDHVWNSNSEAKPVPPASYRERKTKTSAGPAVKARPGVAELDLSAIPKERLPEFIPPQLAFQVESAPDEDGWLHELKLDGYRIQAHKEGAKVKLLTRTGLDWTHRMKNIASEVAKINAESAVLDGEVVVYSANGTTSFADLQASFRDGEKHVLTYVVFDLMHLDGRNLRGAELRQRKAMLASLIAPLGGYNAIVRFSEHLESNGPAVFAKACELRTEGIISKRATGKYVSGRSRSWLKTKCSYEQEFVIGGFTLPSNRIQGVGALLIGYYDEEGKLVYAGRTGTGFTQKIHRALRDVLESLREKESRFEQVPSAFRRGAIWVKPELVAQVRFATWTADNLVRQAAFKGLRDDKPATEVHRERALDESSIQAGYSASHSARTPAAAKAVRPISGKAAELTEEHAKIRLTHPDKIVDEESHLTKQQLADYYWAIADHLLPYIANRPLSLVRCPEGSTKPCFFQKHTNSSLPAGIETVEVPDKKTGKMEPYITISTRESLAAVAQMGVLELHPWGSQNDDLEHPDRIIIDLDPDESVMWKVLAESAKQTRSLLKQLGLESFLKSTGGKGLHVVVPIAPEHDWATIKQFTHAVAEALEKAEPGRYLTKMSKVARKGKIFIDYMRNERGATAIAAFSPRARAGAPVSMPLNWSELADESRPAFAVADFADWKARLTNDPWKNLSSLRQKIDIDKVGEVL